MKLGFKGGVVHELVHVHLQNHQNLQALGWYRGRAWAGPGEGGVGYKIEPLCFLIFWGYEN